MLVKKLVEYTKKLKGDGERFFNTTIAAFFSEGLIPGLADEPYVVDLAAFERSAGSEILLLLSPCAYEFFFSNEYQLGNKEWNVVDVFLKEKGGSLSKAEKDYCRGLRNSYMSIYEVKNIDLSKGVTLRSLVEEEQKDLIVRQENPENNNFAQSDIIGARIIKTEKENILGHGLLVLSEPAAKRIKIALEAVLKTLMTPSAIGKMKEGCADPEVMIKKMWIQKITEIWFYEEMKQRKLSQK